MGKSFVTATKMRQFRAHREYDNRVVQRLVGIEEMPVRLPVLPERVRSLPAKVVGASIVPHIAKTGHLPPAPLASGVHDHAGPEPDTEYKSGDDMLYMQYLRESGDDVQGAVVFRRDPLTGDLESDEATVALKYHGIAGENEFDVLLAENHDATIIGIGGSRSIGGAIWRGDIVYTDSASDSYVEVVTNLSYSWIWGGKNVSGAVEYYYNGVDRHYVAGSMSVEISPLWILTPTLISNADDPSALFQLVTQYSLSDNMTFLGSLNIPLGSNGTEFGGADSGIPNRYLSMTVGVFAQLAWYF